MDRFFYFKLFKDKEKHQNIFTSNFYRFKILSINKIASIIKINVFSLKQVN